MGQTRVFPRARRKTTSKGSQQATTHPSLDSLRQGTSTWLNQRSFSATQCFLSRTKYLAAPVRYDTTTRSPSVRHREY